jgi:inner membrane protein
MRLSIKLLLVLAMSLAILGPLTMIRGTIQERQDYRRQAVAEIAASHAGAQTLAGPVLVVPYVTTVVSEEKDAQGAVRRTTSERSAQWTFFPASLAISGRLQPDVRRRGLHKVRVYTFKGDVHAVFDVTVPASDDDPAHARRIGEPWLDYGIADVRGLAGSPGLRVDGRPRLIEQGTHAGQGIHARLAVPAAGGRLRVDTRLAFALDGTESLALVPLGDANHFTIDSPWPHPQFNGSFLPRDRTVSDAGFHARWDISSLATRAQRQFLDGAGRPGAQSPGVMDEAPAMDVVGLSLVDPVNIYTQADRASKYGLLFVLLTFLGFYMFELLRQLPVHPIQYGLVGLALAIFFLLLVSLSEHIEFAIAYVVSSVACIGLIGVYLSAVLRSAARGVGFAGMLALLYAALYGLLVSEDNALVLGAGLLFVILAAIMLATRRLDWYQLARRPA